MENNILKQLRQCFTKIIPEKDDRTSISPLEFVINLVFSYLGDTQSTSLENIRRQIKNQVKRNMSRSAFWERLSRNRLKQFLKSSITELLKQLGTTVIGGDLAKKLGISGILLVDSSSFSLWDGAKDDFPGVSTTAGIKWHTCIDILTGKLHWFELTPSSTHDRKCFPDLATLRSKLVIMDLGYWDFKLLWNLKEVGAFFLSRLKSNTVVYITQIIQGKISQKYLGTSLLSVPIQRKRSDVIEVMIEKVCTVGTLNCRAIGFWNPSDKCY
ncbi:MAG TPA: IS4/IS5 family transposase, partial [Desulfobacterales bacterium]|nr:IS4/IS5 family transposase [Desulfobacterales bacterium]